jgi:cell cycle sensor histidine kinase DivJ
MGHTPAVTNRATQPADPPDQATVRLLAELSHELRTPLGAIIGFADAMRAQTFGPLNETYAEHAALIGAAGRHLLGLTDDLADMAGAQAGRLEITPEAFDAAQAITEAVRLMWGQAGERGVDLTAALPSEPLMVMADRRRLRQIVFNLVANALKFTPAGGSVSVTAGARDGDLTLAVADTGVGIAEGDLAGLGQAYRQAGDAEHRAMGVGLGLWLARAFAEAHGGTVRIQSAPGAGTTVSVRLPVLI